MWWFRPDGRKMTAQDWNDGQPSLGLFLNGARDPDLGPHGEPVLDDRFLLLFNAAQEGVQFVLPRQRLGRSWTLEVATAEPEQQAGSVTYAPQAKLPLPAHSLAVLRRVS